MQISLTQEGSVGVFTLAGSLDSMTSEALAQALAAQIEAKGVYLVVDFSGVTYTSSAGLRSLLMGLKAARRLQGDLRMASVSPNVLEVLTMAGFTSIIKIYADVPAAVASYSA
jgi:anti-sigma B factor antagonist